MSEQDEKAKADARAWIVRHQLAQAVEDVELVAKLHEALETLTSDRIADPSKMTTDEVNAWQDAKALAQGTLRKLHEAATLFLRPPT